MCRAVVRDQKDIALENWNLVFSSPELKNSKVVSEALLECIRTGDLDSFRDVLTSYLMTADKAALAKKAGLGR